MVSEESLRQKIEACREAVRKLDRERDKLLGQISAYEEILTDIKSTARSATNAGAVLDALIAKGTRGLSPSWKATLKRLSREDSFGYDEVVAAAAKSDMDIEKGTARSRIFSYVDSGYVERIEEGIFRVTQKGREAAE